MPKDRTQEILSGFIADPRGLQKNWGFITSSSNPGVAYGDKAGGKVKVKFLEIQESIVEINLEKNSSGKHYCYPFVANGVGYVEVPLIVDEGTLVFTPGMNGCALSVFKENGKLIFCHDADGKHLGHRSDHLARVTYSDYAPLNQGVKFTESGKGHFSHTIICVFHGGEWYVLNCGVKVHALTRKIEIYHHPMFAFTQDVIVTFSASDDD